MSPLSKRKIKLTTVTNYGFTSDINSLYANFVKGQFFAPLIASPFGHLKVFRFLKKNLTNIQFLSFFMAFYIGI